MGSGCRWLGAVPGADSRVHKGIEVAPAGDLCSFAVGIRVEGQGITWGFSADHWVSTTKASGPSRTSKLVRHTFTDPPTT